MTASITARDTSGRPGRAASLAPHAPTPARTTLHGQPLADEEAVVAGLVLTGKPAFQPAERFLEQRDAGCSGGAAFYPGPKSDGGHAAREVLGDRVLAARQDADTEDAGISQ